MSRELHGADAQHVALARRRAELVAEEPQAAREAESARRISSWTRPARESVAGCARIRGSAASPTAADDAEATRRVLAPLRPDARGDVAQGADMVWEAWVTKPLMTALISAL